MTTFYHCTSLHPSKATALVLQGEQLHGWAVLNFLFLFLLSKTLLPEKGEQHKQNQSIISWKDHAIIVTLRTIRAGVA